MRCFLTYQTLIRWGVPVLLASALALLPAASRAQAPPSAPMVPMVPEVPEVPERIVEAEQEQTAPQPAENPFPPNPNPYPTPAPLASVLQGSIFDSPNVRGYLAESSTTGTLINIDNIASPLSVDVITRDLIQDQQALNFTDIIRNSPGVTPVGDGLFQDRIFIRGLEVRSRDFRKNGFLDPTYTPRDFANIERVEILKGPASVVYGSSAPSGTVNFVTKKPLDDSFGVVGGQFGSWGLQRYTADVNGVVSDEHNIFARVNVAYEDTDSYRDFGFTERHLIAPALTWAPTAYTNITWEAEFIENRRRGDQGLPALNGDARAYRYNIYAGEPANDFIYTEDYRTQLVWTQKLDEDWTASIGLYTVFYEFPASLSYPVAGPFPPVAPNSFARLRQDDEDQESSSSLIANIAGNTEILGMNHKIVAGTEHVYYDSDAAFRGFQLAPIDLANPQYLNPPVGPTAFNTDYPVFRQVRHGYYLQDYVELNEYVQVLGGVRFDDIKLTYDRNFGLGSVRTEQNFEATTPRVGLVLQPIPDIVSIYSNYSRSFNVPGGGGFGFTNADVLSEKGQSVELGVKTQLLDDLFFHVAGFWAERDNVPFSTFTGMGPQYFQVGSERAQGVEFEMLGQITDVWSVVGTYAYTDTRLTDPVNPLIFGQRQRNVPLHSGSLWTRYNLLQDSEQTFGVALGMVAMGDRTANLAGSVDLRDYLRWDGGLFYRRGCIDSQLYLENLFNTDYAASSINEYNIYPGAPFTARAMINWRF